MGAGARRHRAHARGRESNGRRRGREQGARDRPDPRRRASDARAARSGQRPLRCRPRADRQGPRRATSRDLDARVAARGDRVRARRAGRRSTRRRGGCSRSTRRSARSTASPPISAARNYRFDEAVALAREAVALDPTNTRAYADLGMHLMRTGDEAAGAPGARPRVPGRSASTRSPTTCSTCSTSSTSSSWCGKADLIFKLQPDEAPVLREYAMPLAQDALKTLSAKYQFTPKGPILVEIFPKHDDFAVRNLGLPGHDRRARRLLRPRRHARLAARARSPARSRWQATLWHELRTSSRCRCRSSASRAG